MSTARRTHLLAAVAAAALVSAALAATAGAHPYPISSAPADGASLRQPPRALTVRFSERLSPRFRSVHVFDGRGRAVRGLRARGEADAPGVRLTRPRTRGYSV